MTDWLQSLAQSQELPWLSAFALGLLTAISPCPLATNITATAFIAKGFREKRMVIWSGVWYTLGRAVSYVAIALVLYFGASIFHVGRFFQANGEKWLGPLLVIIGLIMLDIIPIHFKGGGALQKITERAGKRGASGAFLLGIIFALAFCPYSGALYFGMLIPMALRSADAFTLPLIFALGTGLPVLVFTYLLAFSFEKVGVWFNAIQKIEKVARYGVGAIFIIVGAYYLYVFLA
ncbi:MAG: sulfite exporter TauE/SafE family protein [Phaeodactylibacter sp.]|nr:sulfite exporter TauE/SafE family protein [Phaeodactylibacter sp.]MCB9051841.1 sulfite exporter TauE/SafE family protein [Lewinellaceae bacterium]